MYSLLSSATVTVVGLSCKAILNVGYASITVNGLPILIAALGDSSRNHGQGVVTVSNHISTLDDPVTWGVLPASYFLNSRTTRWALGASDIMFTNPIFSTLFRLGQTIETFRGKGVDQPAVDLAIEKLNQGDWVHLYCEGKVNQPDTYSKDENGIARLPRFKWGVGRMLMEATFPPVVIPMWLTGFDKLMPEGRSFPYKYFPCLGAQLGVTFGDPIPAERIRKVLGVLETDPWSSHLNFPIDGHQALTDWTKNQGFERLPSLARNRDATAQRTLQARAEITAIVQNGVESLGRSVCGDLLSRSSAV